MRHLDEPVYPETELIFGQGEIGLHIARLLKEVIRDEIKPRRRPDVGFATGGFHDFSSDRSHERVQLVEVGFEEAPFHLWIVGKGPAGAVRDAGALALVERDILLGAQIEAEIVGITGKFDSALGLGGENRRAE
ncbi:hypothetical protein ACVJMZ_004251 [Sinorhizobium medicae]